MIKLLVVAAAAMAVLVPVSNAREMHGDMMMPSMEQCHNGYQKMYKTSMHWSKHSFKHACKKMMKHEAKMSNRMMKDKMMKDKM